MAEGLARSGFDVDLSFGEARESAFVNAITRAHAECKSDQRARETGNVFIEIRQGSTTKGEGKPSGISVTTSQWWSHEYADDCWVTIRTSLLKHHVRRAIQEKRVVMGGDFNRYEGALVPIRWLFGDTT